MQDCNLSGGSAKADEAELQPESEGRPKADGIGRGRRLYFLWPLNERHAIGGDSVRRAETPVSGRSVRAGTGVARSSAILEKVVSILNYS